MTGELFREALAQYAGIQAEATPVVARPLGAQRPRVRRVVRAEAMTPGLRTLHLNALRSLLWMLRRAVRQATVHLAAVVPARRRAVMAGVAVLACLVPALAMAQAPPAMTDATGRPLLPHEQVERMLREKTGRTPSPALVRGVASAMQELHAMPGSSGTLDTSFDTDGKQTIDFTDSDDFGFNVAIDGSGRIVVAGYKYASGTFDFAVVRLTSEGTLDTSFDTDGKQTVDFGSAYDIGYGVAIDGSGRIVVSGYILTGSGFDFAVARLTSAGALDTSFDTDGKQTIDFTDSDDSGYSVAIDGSGRIVVAGYTNAGSGFDFAVARLTDAGTLDTDFDSDGKQTVDFTDSDAYGRAVAIDGSGRIIVAGSTWTWMGDTSYDFAVARLTSAGALDTGFDNDGKQTVDFGGPGDNGSDVAVDGSGRIVVAGYTDAGGTYDFVVARLTGAGALDTGFDADGKQTINFGGTDDGGYGVAIDGSGRIVVSGYTNASGIYDIAVARLSEASSVPDAPTLAAPAAGATVPSLAPTLDWDAPATGEAPTGYTVEVRVGSAAGTPIAGSPFAVTAPTTQLALSGLSPGTTYYWSVAGTSAGGTGTAASRTFTVPPLPTVATQAAVEITATEATLGGSANPNGWPTLYHYVYGKMADLSDGASTDPQGLPGDAGDVSLPFRVGGLASGTTHYAKFVAVTDGGTVEGAIVSFKTDVAGATGLG
ncbi:MAG TPA: fibronectin type III domain-containing protein, partial [Rhodothermales bacterium]|nr:fibronectin type III domain-containing protein [Rhodothermales bacterium]